MDKTRLSSHYQNIRQIFKDLGEDPDRNCLEKTPARMISAWQYLTSGYTEDAATILNDALFDVEYQDMVVIRDIEIYSLCEHHMLPFYGRCHVGYIPRDKVVGLSKLPRLVDIFARRLQVQERLTHQIAETIAKTLKPLGVGVVIEAYHLCMMMRGVGKQNSFTMTSSMQGQFQNLETRTEFLNLIRSNKP